MWYYYGVLVIDTFFNLFFCLSDGYFHEISHAKRAEKLKPSLKMVIILFIPFARPKKRVIGQRTIYSLPMHCRTQYLKSCRFNVEDNFRSFSDSEILVTAEAGLNSTKRRLNMMIILSIALGFFVSFVVFVITRTKMMKSCRDAKARTVWNDYRAVYYPSEYRDEYCCQKAFEQEVDYNSMVAHGERYTGIKSKKNR